MDYLGWISLHRRIKDHWIWKSQNRFQWWIDLLLTVNHEDKKVLIGGTLLDCKRGQSVRSLENWAKDWNVTKKTVRDFFILLQKDNMIQFENVKISTRITICNYDSYQISVNDKETDSKHLVNDKETDSKRQLPTNNNDNNDNNDNKDNLKPEIIELDFKNISSLTWLKWTDFKKSQFKFQYKNQQSEQIALNELINLSKNDPVIADKIVNHSIANGYKGLFELKTNGQSKKTESKLGY